MDSLVGEILHIPERFTVLVVIENEGINELGEVLRDKGYFVVQESKKKLILDNTFIKNIDIIILKGKNFLLSSNNIANKEKGFVDLYYAVTRLDYNISIPELSRIHESMHSNNMITKYRMKQSSKDRGIIT